jgi:hypothetical protein
MRTLFVLVTIVACAWGAWARQANRLANQRRAVEMLNASLSFGKKTVLWCGTGHNWDVNDARAIHKPNGWYKLLFRADDWISVVELSIWNYAPLLQNGNYSALKWLPDLESLSLTTIWKEQGEANDEVLRYLDHLPKLKRFTVHSKMVTNQGLVHVASLTQLEQLSLDVPNLTDEGLKSIGKLKSLKELTINSGSISATGLSYLSDLKFLEELSLADCGFSHDGLGSLPESIQASVTYVKLDAAMISPATIVVLQKAPRLETVRIETPANDEVCALIGGLPQIKVLTLEGASITDRGLAALVRFNNLRELTIHNTSITDQGLTSLQSLIGLEELHLDGNPRAHPL